MTYDDECEFTDAQMDEMHNSNSLGVAVVAVLVLGCVLAVAGLV